MSERKRLKTSMMIEEIGIWLIGAVAMAMAAAGVVGAVIYHNEQKIHSPVLKTEFFMQQRSNASVKRNFGEF
jgi:uncharacterized iron-regulated membrane protein